MSHVFNFLLACDRAWNAEGWRQPRRVQLTLREFAELMDFVCTPIHHYRSMGPLTFDTFQLELDGGTVTIELEQ